MLLSKHGVGFFFPELTLFSSKLYATTDALYIIGKEANSDILADVDLVLTLRTKCDPFRHNYLSFIMFY